MRFPPHVCTSPFPWEKRRQDTFIFLLIAVYVSLYVMQYVSRKTTPFKKEPGLTISCRPGFWNPVLMQPFKRIAIHVMQRCTGFAREQEPLILTGSLRCLLGKGGGSPKQGTIWRECNMQQSGATLGGLSHLDFSLGLACAPCAYTKRIHRLHFTCERPEESCLGWYEFSYLFF